MEKKIKVKSCNNCPFGSWTTGGTNSTKNRRLHLHCNLQEDHGHEWIESGSYSCFKSCPLKTQEVNVTLNRYPKN